MTSRLARITVGGTPRVVDLLASSSGTAPSLLPFAATSPWRLGIASAATFAASGDTRNTAIHNTGADGSGQVWVNSSTFSHPISFATNSDPLATVTDVEHGGSWSERIPAIARIAGGADQHMHVITPGGLAAQEHYLVTRNSTTSYSVHRRAQVDLTGSGIGPNNGVRAYGGSAIAGLIRAFDVTAGVIRHPLAIALRHDQMFDNGTGGGFVWPATEQDGNSASTYTGTIPMGSYFAIPPTVNLATLGLQTSQGMMLAKAAQDYGCYVVDSSSAAVFFCEDDAGVAAAFATAVLGGGSFSAHDPRVVFNALRVVSGNASATPNGGALGVSRRG